MAQLLEQFKALPTWQKVLVIIGLPLVIAYFAPNLISEMGIFVEKEKEKSVDNKSAQEDKKIQDNTVAIAVEETHVDTLQAEKAEAVKDASLEDAVKFANDRKPTE